MAKKKIYWQIKVWVYKQFQLTRGVFSEYSPIHNVEII